MRERGKARAVARTAPAASKSDPPNIIVKKGAATTAAKVTWILLYGGFCCLIRFSSCQASSKLISSLARERETWLTSQTFCMS